MQHYLKLLGLGALAALMGPLAAHAQAPALTLVGGGTPLTIAGGATLTVVGNATVAPGTTLQSAGGLSVSGTLSAPAATLRLDGAGAQAIGAAGTVGELVLDKPSGTATLSKALAVADVLRLTSGTLATANQLTLLSTAARQAYAVHAGGTTSGTVAVQRFVPGPVALSYHHLSSPVQSTTVADLATTGFTPRVTAAYNPLPTPTLPANQLPNVFGYDETRGGAANANFGDGYFSPTSLSAPLASGLGYAVYLPGQRTPDFVGALTSGPVSVPLTLTGNPATNGKAGWHLVGNPYPQPIDWDLYTAPNGIDASVFVWYSTGGTSGAYRVRNGSGVGNLTDGLIGVGQGFFVRRTPGTPPVSTASLAFTNALRVEANVGLGRAASAARPLLTLSLTDAATGRHDETTVYAAAAATVGYDGHHDAVRPGRNAGVPTLSALIAGQEAMISALPEAIAHGQSATVELTAVLPTVGRHTLAVSTLTNWGATSVELLDYLTGTRYDLHSTPSVTLTAARANEVVAGRFALVFNGRHVLSTAADVAITARALTVWPNPSSGAASVRVSGALAGAAVRVYDATGRTVATLTADATGTAELVTRELAVGVYVVRAQDGRATRLVVE